MYDSLLKCNTGLSRILRKSVAFCQSTQRHSSEASTLHNHYHENLKSLNLSVVQFSVQQEKLCTEKWKVENHEVWNYIVHSLVSYIWINKCYKQRCINPGTRSTWRQIFVPWWLIILGPVYSPSCSWNFEKICTPLVIIMAISSMRRWTGHVARMEEEGICF
jgi:hypothetical protein